MCACIVCIQITLTTVCIQLHFFVRIVYTGLLTAFSCTSPNMHAYNFSIIYNDQIYLLKIIIAIIDHNHHIERECRQSKSGEIQHHRVWKRRSNNLDAVPRKVKKDYAYVPEILLLIFRYHEQMDQPLHSIMGKKRLGSTITPEPPPSTAEIVKRKKSRLSAQFDCHFIYTKTKVNN